MKMMSAYLTLGVPGNASIEDIDIAYERAKLLYSPERRAASNEAAQRFLDVETAYNVLRDPQSRAAHNRKLAAVPRASGNTRPVVQFEEESPVRKYLIIGLSLVVLLFAVGLYLNSRNVDARKKQAEIELAAKDLAVKEEQQRVQAVRAQADLARARLQEQLRADAAERRLSAEGRAAVAQAAADNARVEAMAAQVRRNDTAEAQRQAATARSEEQQNAAAAQRRLAMDKQRIRELCYQQYRRFDC